MTGNRHIVIAGGGMVGLSLALLLTRKLPALHITLVESAALQPAASGVQGYHPSFDARSTALSYSTAQIYRELGIWERLLPGLAPIHAIHVSSRGHFGSSLLHDTEQGWEALGWVVENPCLGRSLLAAVAEEAGIALHCPARASAAVPEAGGVSITVQNSDGSSEILHADLLVIADGAESQLREQLGFFTRRRSYGQDALIANIAFPSALEGCAYERFTASGPLAVLPLPPSSGGENRAALVWTLPPAEAARLAECDEQAFCDALVDAFGYRLGRPLRVGQRHRYSLALTEAVEQVRRAMVVVGNAAHALHPVAGQGFNLALRDMACLAGAIVDAVQTQRSPGDVAVLEAYLAQRERDQAQTVFASDGLPQLFALSDPIIALSRDLALAGMDLLPAARRLFVQQAAGMAALESAGV